MIRLAYLGSVSASLGTQLGLVHEWTGTQMGTKDGSVHGEACTHTWLGTVQCCCCGEAGARENYSRDTCSHTPYLCCCFQWRCCVLYSAVCEFMWREHKTGCSDGWRKENKYSRQEMYPFLWVDAICARMCRTEPPSWSLRDLKDLLEGKLFLIYYYYFIIRFHRPQDFSYPLPKSPPLLTPPHWFPQYYYHSIVFHK